MKDNPLVSALSKGRATPPSIKFEDVPSRTLEVNHSEIPGLPGRHPGEHITVSVQGHISSHGDGTSTLQVHHIAPDSPAMDKEEFGEPDAIRVIPPESPVPS